MDNILIHDVAECFVVDDVNNKTYFLGYTDSNNVSQAVDQTPLRSGIGNKRITTLNNSKDLSFEVVTTLHNDSIYEMQSGSIFSNEAISLLKQETVQAKDVTGSIVCTITGTPVGDVTVIDKHGKELSGTFATGKVTITSGAAGEYYTVIYTEAEATANVLDLDSESFPQSYKVQLHSIAYDTKNDEVIADVYWLFSQARPDGNFQSNYAKGENQTDTIKFNCETPHGAKSYGKYATIMRT